MKNISRSLLFSTLCLFLALVSCGGDPLDVDVSDVDVDIQFDRFEQELCQAKSAEDLIEINQRLLEKGGELYEFYTFDILGSGPPTGDSIHRYLWFFINDTVMKQVHEDIQLQFGHFEETENRIVDLFKHLKYHLPEAPQPRQVITYNSTFRYGVTSTSDRLGIGLEMYLGESNRVIERIGYPLYMKAKMDADYLPVDVARSWIIENIMGESRGETFLSSMIYFGKLQYLVDATMPDIEDHLKIRYTEEEYEYAIASEYNVWQYLLDMNWIYETDVKVKMRFFEEAPTTVGIEESPGRLGQFMGWRMVRQYMEKNEEVSVEELMNKTKEGDILKAYKPQEL